MFMDVVPIKRGCPVLDGVKLLECCSRTHPGKWGVFHHTPDLCLVDDGQALGSQVVSYPPQNSQPLTCSGSHCVYVVSPVEFLVNGSPKDVDSGGFSNSNKTLMQPHSGRPAIGRMLLNWKGGKKKDLQGCYRDLKV